MEKKNRMTLLHINIAMDRKNSHILYVIYTFLSYSIYFFRLIHSTFSRITLIIYNTNL